MKWFVIENTWLRKAVPPEVRAAFPELYDIGWGNGYALIPQGHVLYGVPYDEINVDAPGGLTYGSIITEAQLEVFGLNREDLGMYCVGFDTCHYEDTLEKWPKEAVEHAAMKLAQELELIDITNYNNE